MSSDHWSSKKILYQRSSSTFIQSKC